MQVYTRGGLELVTQLPWSTISFERRLEDVGEATVEVPVSSERLREVLCDIRPWEHEVCLLRDGEAQWIGPVQSGTERRRESVTLQAADLFVWFEHRLLLRDLAFEQMAMRDIFTQIVAEALAFDASPGINVIPQAAGQPGTRIIEGSEATVAADVLRELGRTGVDWALIGRDLYVSGTELSLGPLARLVDPVVADVATTSLETATQVVVLGEERIEGFAGGIDPALGLLQVAISEDAIGDAPSARVGAQSRLDLLKDQVPRVTLRLLPTAPVDFRDLVPGVRVPLAIRERALCDLCDEWRLESVTLEVDAEREVVTLALQPVGTRLLEGFTGTPEETEATEMTTEGGNALITEDGDSIVTEDSP